MSIAASALLVVTAAVLATLAGCAALGRLIPAERAAEAEPTAHAVLEAMAALYGVLVAFVLAGAWDRLDQTRAALTLEANAITDLQQTARILPAPTRDELGRAVDAYRESVREELRLLAAGRTSTEPDALVDRMLRILAGFQPETAGQAELQSRAFDVVQELRDQRGVRLVMARRTPPAVLWAILIAGGVAVLAVAAATSLGGRLRATYVALLAAVIAFALFAIYALSHPVRSGLAAETASLFDHVLRAPLRPD
ncbi:MAG TPA: DUF4239 domain-containing protein [Longimicrobiales bacterium]